MKGSTKYFLAAMLAAGVGGAQASMVSLNGPSNVWVSDAAATPFTHTFDLSAVTFSASSDFQLELTYSNVASAWWAGWSEQWDVVVDGDSVGSLSNTSIHGTCWVNGCDHTEASTVYDLLSPAAGSTAVTFSFAENTTAGLLGVGPEPDGFRLISATLNISDASQTAVPLPAAAWLFGSALVGMMGLGARRKMKA